MSLRSLLRDKSYSLINILGLSIGIASAILILLWVENEYSYNNFVPNHKNIFQVKRNSEFNGRINTEDAISIPVYQTLKNTDGRIKNTCFTSWTYGHTITRNNKIFSKEGIAVSAEFLEIFDIPMIAGSAQSSLADPYSIVLNESTSKEIFGNTNPINQFVKWDNNKELKVTGIFKDVPSNSTFWFHVIVPVSFYEVTEKWISSTGSDWNHFGYPEYAELEPGTNVDDINDLIKDILKGHGSEGMNHELFLQSLDRWHLYDNFENGSEAGGKIEYVRLFTCIAVLTLLIACINYTNLATARSERRAKEVGIRKSIGSQRSELIIQFLAESFLTSSVAFVIAILLVELSLPAYNTLVHKQLHLNVLSLEFLSISIAIIIVTSLMAGFYPAFYFSSFQPVKILKNRIQIGKIDSMPRKTLVILQYVFAIFLIVGMVVMYQQTEHVKSRELGYEQQNLIMIAFNDEIGSNYHVIKQELLKSGRVESVNRSDQTIYHDVYKEFVDWKGKTTDEQTSFVAVSTDQDYVETMGIKILEGRDFSEDYSSDSSAALVNKTAVKLMGFSEPIGEVIKFRGIERTIIGVVDDVLMGSPFDPIGPLIIHMAKSDDSYGYVNIRLSKTEDLHGSIQAVIEIFRKLNPSNDVSDVMFADSNFAEKYQSIKLIGSLASLFALLAIFLTCLGVFGLAAYTAEQRAKEMAIRKVLGATLSNLLLHLSRYFVRIVLSAVVISAPISWLTLNSYLDNYSYRISIPWWTIPAISICILIITIIIVITQVIKGALVNPARILKSE